MTALNSRSAELFEQLVQALVDEGMQTGQFDIDSMRYAQMELLGHGLGKELSRRVQATLADRQGQRMAKAFSCPACGRECASEQKPKPITSLDGDLNLPETRCYCKSCRKSFFPST